MSNKKNMVDYYSVVKNGIFKDCEKQGTANL